ncbi:hypothetical protein MPSEU_000753100 [Mayamaea pseudoterrestris]|nr:hypothetical protein MPSEU_000753100 [Mayamaea pseudoterrestris]
MRAKLAETFDPFQARLAGKAAEYAAAVSFEESAKAAAAEIGKTLETIRAFILADSDEAFIQVAGRNKTAKKPPAAADATPKPAPPQPAAGPSPAAAATPTTTAIIPAAITPTPGTIISKASKKAIKRRSKKLSAAAQAVLDDQAMAEQLALNKAAAGTASDGADRTYSALEPGDDGCTDSDAGSSERSDVFDLTNTEIGFRLFDTAIDLVARRSPRNNRARRFT